MIKITDEAKTIISKQLKKNPSRMLRLVISGFGWGGPRMELVLDEPRKEEIHSFNNIDIMVEKSIKDYISPTIIDGVKNVFGNHELIVRPAYGGC